MIALLPINRTSVAVALGSCWARAVRAAPIEEATTTREMTSVGLAGIVKPILYTFNAHLLVGVTLLYPHATSMATGTRTIFA